MIVITLADVVGSWSWRGLYIKCQVVNYAMLATIMSFVEEFNTSTPSIVFFSVARLCTLCSYGKPAKF